MNCSNPFGDGFFSVPWPAFSSPAARRLIVIFNLQVIVEFLRRNGYRNSILGRDGLNPTVQMIILIAAGGAVFLVSFAMCMDSVVRYVREISNGITRIAGGDLNTEISVRGQR